MKFSVFFVLIVFFSHGFAEQMKIPEDRYDKELWNKFKNHQGFYPYICEFGYRTLADHVIDPTRDYFDPDTVKLGDSIYVAVWLLEWFEKEVHDLISEPYVLITCDVDSWIPRPHSHSKLVFDLKVAAWYGKNMIFTNHMKLFQLPMGQLVFLWQHGFSQYRKKLDEVVSRVPLEKDYLLYMNHTERDHGRRIEIANLFCDKPYCFSRNRSEQSRVDFLQYWIEAAKSKFVISPLGLEVDCTRTWECFILDSIPVIEHSYLDPLYDDLPVLFVHDWNEINEDYLERKYLEFCNKNYRKEKAYLDYWANEIKKTQDKIRSGNYMNASLESQNFSDQELSEIQVILKHNNKLSKEFFYVGMLTMLRPYQLAQKIQNLSKIQLFDPWATGNKCYLLKFSKNKMLLLNSKVRLNGAYHPHNLSSDWPISCFLDLKHFRHRICPTHADFIDFSHSLEESILIIIDTLKNGDLLFGNMLEDNYVRSVLERLTAIHGFRFEKNNDFWWLLKQ